MTRSLPRLALVATLILQPVLLPVLPPVMALQVDESTAIGQSANNDQAAHNDQAAESDQPAKSEATLDERLDALLAEALPAEEYRETKRCLSRHDYRSVDILNQEYLLFRKSGQFWLNKLKHRCIVLRRDLILVFNQHGMGGMCSGDLAYVTDRYDLERGFSPSGRPLAAQGTCRLGEFESITAEQAALLRGLR
jgi:hypothetical protein